MSSMDQAFVKSFARRNQAGPSQFAGDQVAGSQATAKPEELGSLTLDPSVASTAELWVDPIEDQIARADPAEFDVPKPHVQPQTDPEPSTYSLVNDVLQHHHTTYATAFPFAPAAPADAPRPEPISPTQPVGAAQPISPPQPMSAAEPVGTVEPASSLVPTSEQAPPVRTTLPVEQFATTDFVEMRVDVPVANANAPHSSAAPINEPIASEPEVNEPEINEPIASEPEINEPIASEPLANDTYVSEPAASETLANDPHVSAAHPSVPFHAVWEVDVFDVPSCVADLFFEGKLFQQISERMSEAVNSGLKSMLVTSTKPGEGRSSTAIGLAMAAAAAGIRVALVDADAEAPTLANDLCLDLQFGWVDTIRGGLPIKEVAVNAIEDGVTLIPLMPPHGPTAATTEEIIRLIELVTDKFELVIIDGPSGKSPSIRQCIAAVDSAVVVRDVTRTDTAAINEFSYRLREFGVRGVGVVENFA